MLSVATKNAKRMSRRSAAKTETQFQQPKQKGKIRANSCKFVVNQCSSVAQNEQTNPICRIEANTLFTTFVPFYGKKQGHPLCPRCPPWLAIASATAAVAKKNAKRMSRRAPRRSAAKTGSAAKTETQFREPEQKGEIRANSCVFVVKQNRCVAEK